MRATEAANAQEVAVPDRTRDLVQDLLVPVALVVLGVLEVTRGYADHPAGPVALLSVVVPMSLVTARRRQAPVAVAAAVAVSVVVIVVALEPDLASQPPLTPFLALLVALFSLGVHGEGPGFVPGATAVLLCLAALQVATALAGAPVGDVTPSTIFMGTAFVLGRLIHRSRREARAARERATEAADLERSRIARELHDVLAHALSAITIQASVEARLAPDPDSSAARTLREIERQGRSAMAELRLLLGILRADGQAPASAPLPSLAGVAELAEDLRRSGHEVEVRLPDELGEVPSGVDLSAYRLVQEALTNAARHAPGSRVRVAVERRADHLEVEVADDGGLGTPRALPPGGHGLAGMRERVRLYGGELDAGPDGDGRPGWRVRAVLPLAGSEART